MSEVEQSIEARRWLRYAQEDLVAAEAMVGQPKMAPRHACWLAQQAAEKALKAVLVFLQIDFPDATTWTCCATWFPPAGDSKRTSPTWQS